MAPPPQENPPPPPPLSFIFTILQIALIYYGMNYLMKSTTTTTTESTQVGSSLQVKQPISRNSWNNNQIFHLYVYLSIYKDFGLESNKIDTLFWKKENLKYNWESSNNRVDNITIPVTDYLVTNGSLYAHIFYVKENTIFDVDRNLYDDSTVYTLNELIVYKPKPKMNIKKNLISGKYADERVQAEIYGPGSIDLSIGDEQKRIMEIKNAPIEIISFFKPTLHLKLVHDFTVFPKGQIPETIGKHFTFDKSGQTYNYYPVSYVDDFWTRSEHLIQINNTLSELHLEISYAPLSLWKWQMQVSMEESWKMQSDWGAHTDGDTDEVKRILTETDPWLLGITMFASILHSVFDVLAFKNDINFWQKNESVEGISVRTIFLNVFCQIIILLYLIDNETTWMILISAFVGLLIEFWKINKAADVVITWNGSIPTNIQINEKKSYVESLTNDKEAMTYLSYVFYPLAVCYAIYSVMYNEHKGFYSFTISTMVSFIYTFGFIMMCPQLYLNYKLKSVAHLPWRMLTYKFLNTFIDDLFAFVIKMPTMHRLACFRDDIIFFIYLYQRWNYRVDLTRVNEFGLTPITPEEATKVTLEDTKAALKEAKKPATFEEIDESEEPVVKESKSDKKDK